MSVFEIIEKQQQDINGTPAWMIGEQLKDICRREPLCAELVEKDLQMSDMGIADCARKLKDYADKQHKKSKRNCVCVTPIEAEKIIRDFYGLQAPGETSKEHTPFESSYRQSKETNIIDISDLLI